LALKPGVTPVHGTEPRSLSFFASGDDCKKTHANMHIYIYLYFYFSGLENLCHYTLSPRGPNHRELGSWGLGWTCGASPLGASPENHYDSILFGNSAASLLSGPSSDSVPQVRDSEVMKLRIMP
jgi:hypothetical protein